MIGAKYYDHPDPTGKTIGQLSVLRKLPESTPGNPRFQCRCSCGVEVAVYLHQLVRAKPDRCMKCRKQSSKRSKVPRGDLARAGWGGKLPPTKRS